MNTQSFGGLLKGPECCKMIPRPTVIALSSTMETMYYGDSTMETHAPLLWKRMHQYYGNACTSTMETHAPVLWKQYYGNSTMETHAPCDFVWRTCTCCQFSTILVCVCKYVCMHMLLRTYAHIWTGMRAYTIMCAEAAVWNHAFTRHICAHSCMIYGVLPASLFSCSYGVSVKYDLPKHAQLIFHSWMCQGHALFLFQDVPAHKSGKLCCMMLLRTRRDCKLLHHLHDYVSCFMSFWIQYISFSLHTLSWDGIRPWTIMFIGLNVYIQKSSCSSRMYSYTKTQAAFLFAKYAWLLTGSVHPIAEDMPVSFKAY